MTVSTLVQKTIQKQANNSKTVKQVKQGKRISNKMTSKMVPTHTYTHVRERAHGRTLNKNKNKQD